MTKRERAKRLLFTNPERMSSIHEAGAKRHGCLWLRANIAAVNAANSCGLNAEEHKIPISQIVLRVLDTTLTENKVKMLLSKRIK